ncbi:MAG: ABC transporter ATP-binding protein [Cyclobacteriaceae bacterium]|nr:ABC transporter ATP-binding protein [Cyclobacteriaceae bacterium]
MLLKLENVHKSFFTGNPQKKRVVLDGIDLELVQGETVAILGPSGSGKSTLLNIIGALDRQDSGEIFFNGRSMAELNEKQLTQFRNREIGFIFQLHHLLPQCTVLENVLLPAVPVRDPGYRAECLNRAYDLIREVGLWEQRDQHPNVLSGGESQRVAVIRALINRPGLLLADEPTGSLDQKNVLSILSLLLKLNDEYNASLIVVTHSMEIASRMGRIYELRNGKFLNTR